MSNFCSNCGAEKATGGFCPGCGKSLGAVPASQGKGLAIAALILAIFPYTSWIGLILGYVARSKNRASKQAKAAIIIGWIIFALEVIGGAILGVMAASGGY